jgi:hypothetical protein
VRREEGRPRWDPRAAAKPATAKTEHTPPGYAVGMGVPTFPDNMDLITQEPYPALVVVDAWLDTVPPKLSMRDTQQARQALQPWKDVASKTGAAIHLLAHANRIASGSARVKYGATLQLRKVCRVTTHRSLGRACADARLRNRGHRPESAEIGGERP